MPQAFANILPLFILIGCGYILFKFKIADLTWTKAFNIFSINVGFPCLIFYSLYKSDLDIELLKDLGILQFTYLIVTFVLVLTTIRHNKLNTSIVSCAIFHNIAFLGIPIINSLYNDDLSNVTAIISACYLAFFFTFGIGYLEWKETSEVKWSKVIVSCLKNPLLISVILGLISQFSGIKIPEFIIKPIGLIAQAITPIILISLGIFLSSISLKETQWRPILLFSFYTLLAAPLICFGVSALLNINSDVSVLEAAMPVAFTPFALTERYKSLSKVFIAEVIFASTVLSIFTIPLFFSIIQ